MVCIAEYVLDFCFDNTTYNSINNITSIALKSSEARAQKRDKTKSLIIFKSRGHAEVIISLTGRRLFKVENISTGMYLSNNAPSLHRNSMTFEARQL